MFKAGKYNYVFIHREAAPLGPPIFEWILAKILRKKIIYDFDDAIWLPATSIHNRHVAYFKWNKKVAYICKWSYKISCGNAYLAEFAKKYNNNVIINPTTIDTENLHIINDSMQKSEDIPILGWTGTHSTIPYLKLIESALQKLEVKHSFILQVISNQPPDLNLSRLNYIEWNKLTEIQDLQNIDIGLMPLNEDKWSQGKCGFKSLQYMALAIPALVSPVGVNKDIIEHGENGFHCKNEEDWIQYIEKLITDKMLRKKMGVKGRIKVVEQFSILSNKENFLKLFE
jgi:glycosyltransferase involved in cell wall biosynthesis